MKSLLAGLCLLLVAANLWAGPPAKRRGIDGRALYGYGPFEEAQESNLESIGEYRSSGRIVKLLGPAAQSFREMQAEALRDGVVLVPVSGFRENKRQAVLFRRAVRKHGSQKKAARWVAPPGFSHHEAGLAIDLGDESSPQCDVRRCFNKTRAYKWLTENAERFGFALNRPRSAGSRPPREPWHWRFMPPVDTDQASTTD